VVDELLKAHLKQDLIMVQHPFPLTKQDRARVKEVLAVFEQIAEHLKTPWFVRSILDTNLTGFQVGVIVREDLSSEELSTLTRISVSLDTRPYLGFSRINEFF